MAKACNDASVKYELVNEVRSALQCQNGIRILTACVAEAIEIQFPMFVAPAFGHHHATLLRRVYVARSTSKQKNHLALAQSVVYDEYSTVRHCS